MRDLTELMITPDTLSKTLGCDSCIYTQCCLITDVHGTEKLFKWLFFTVSKYTPAGIIVYDLVFLCFDVSSGHPKRVWTQTPGSWSAEGEQRLRGNSTGFGYLSHNRGTLQPVGESGEGNVDVVHVTLNFVLNMNSMPFPCILTNTFLKTK